MNIDFSKLKEKVIKPKTDIPNIINKKNDDLVLEKKDDEENLLLIKKVNEITQYYISSNMVAIKIKKINDFMCSTYNDIQLQYLDFVQNNKLLSKNNNQEFINKILHFVMSKNIDEEFLLNLSKQNCLLCDEFCNFTYLYLTDSIDLGILKTKIFLITHQISPNYFNNITKNALFALCELCENGMDFKEYKDMSNLKIVFLNDVARGKYKSKENYINKAYMIIDFIEQALTSNEMTELIFKDDYSLIFEKNYKNEICIYNNNDLDSHIAKLNYNLEFVSGSLNTLLININNNTKEDVEEENVLIKNTLDNIISGYNPNK